MSAAVHVSVMRDEVVTALAPCGGRVYADCTLGAAGHGMALLEGSAPDGLLIGLDRDAEALARAGESLAHYGARVRLHHRPFSELGAALAEEALDGVDGLVADLGLSSDQLETPERGFSFRFDGPLDMRMDTSRGEPASELVARLRQDELANLIYELGEERMSRRVAKRIKEAVAVGGCNTTAELRSIVHKAMGPRRRGRIDPATRTFQALRLAVNDELGELRALLAALPTLLRPGGVAAIISFHSLEDRAVKHFFRDEPQLEVLTKRPLRPSEAELAENPRSRSAKLRVARRVL